MDKQKYYVSVGSKEILRDPTCSSYQFEIEATEKEVARLHRLFASVSAASGDGFLEFRAREKDKNYSYDQVMSSIYQEIYQLGDDVAKEHITSMGILE